MRTLDDSPRLDNQSGLVGAHQASPNGKWSSRIKVKGVTHYLGYFYSAQDAHDAYMAKKLELLGPSRQL